MTKQQMLMEYITQDIVAFIMEDEHIPMEVAMQRLYTSQTFLKLTDPETGLYLDSSASVYELYRNENRSGRIVQVEI